MPIATRSTKIPYGANARSTICPRAWDDGALVSVPRSVGIAVMSVSPVAARQSTGTAPKQQAVAGRAGSALGPERDLPHGVAIAVACERQAALVERLEG